MQIPIMNGIYADQEADFRTGYPVNMLAVPKSNGISQGYLRTADGVRKVGNGIGKDRGAIVYGGYVYRVSGQKLIRYTNGTDVEVLGDISGTGYCTLDFGFDRLSISNGTDLYYWTGTLTRVTDPDVLTVVDHCWVDGYWMVTNGVTIAVSDLTDPTQFDPLKYGSAESDPDRIVALVRPRDEVYAVGRHSIEVFSNVGGTGFPFARIDGATIGKGAVGTQAATVFAGTVAFVGNDRREAPSVYLVAGSGAQAVSTREIDLWLSSYMDDELEQCRIETRKYDSHELLYVHMPDRTAVYDLAASQVAQQPIWSWMSTSVRGTNQYCPSGYVYFDGEWYTGCVNNGDLGVFDRGITRHFSKDVGWEFTTQAVYSDGRGAIIHQLELVGLFGAEPNNNPTAFLSWSKDGIEWSDEKSKPMGVAGQRNVRPTWFRVGMFRNWIALKVRAANVTVNSIARMEAQIEALNG